MAKVKNGSRITADGTAYYVEGMIPGRSYLIGLIYDSGTGTMNDIGQSLTATSTLNEIYASDHTTELSITATTTRGYRVQMLAPFLRFTIASASSLVAQLVVQPVHHGY